MGALRTVSLRTVSLRIVSIANCVDSELLLKFRIPAMMVFMSVLNRDPPSEKGGQSRHFNRSMLSSFRERSAKNESRASPRPPAEFGDNLLKRQDSWRKCDLDFLPPDLDFLPPDLDFLPTGLDFLPSSLETLHRSLRSGRAPSATSKGPRRPSRPSRRIASRLFSGSGPSRPPGASLTRTSPPRQSTARSARPPT
jgi:hypothetical protein